MNSRGLLSDQRPILTNPVKQEEQKISAKEIPFGTSRLPISTSLLDILQNINSISSESELNQANEKLKEALNEYVKRIEKKQIPLEILSLFDFQDEQKKGKQLELNWNAVILKLHSALLENERTSNFIHNIRTKRATSGNSATQEKTETLPTSPNAPKSSEGEKRGVPNQRLPQLLKTTAPFIPIKAHQEAPTKVLSRVISTDSSSSSSTPKTPYVIEGDAQLGTSLPSIGKEKPELGTSVNWISPKNSLEDDDSRTSSNLSTSAPYKQMVFFASPPGPHSIVSPPSKKLSSVQPSSAIDMKNTKDQDAPWGFTGSAPFSFSEAEPQVPIPEVKQKTVNLPPTRLTESLVRSSTIGQSFAFSKTPHIDPMPISNQDRQVSGSFTESLLSPPNSSVLPPQSLRAPSSVSHVEPSTVSSEPEIPAPQPQTVSIISPFSYFRRTDSQQQLVDEKFNSVAHSFHSVEDYPYKNELPTWLDIMLYWGKKDPASKDTQPPALYIHLESVLLSLNSRGHYDFALQAALSYIVYQLASHLKDDLLEDVLKRFVAHYKPSFNEKTSVEYLRSEMKALKALKSDRFASYINDILFNSTNEVDLQKLLNKIEEDILFCVKVNHTPSLQSLEQLLINLLGDPQPKSREFAAKLLNVIYDGHDWQNSEPFIPVIRTIGDSFALEVDVTNQSIDEDNIHLLVCSPVSNGGYMLSRYKPVLKKDNKLTVEHLPSFKRAGYYDWRLVVASPEGKLRPLQGKHVELSKLQGRVIVHPQIRDEIMHEVWVDLQDCDWDRNTGNILKRGNFQSITKGLQQLRRSLGVTTLYVMGALDRQNWSGPFTPIDRSSPNKHLGGQKDFDDLLNAAKNLGIKVVVDSTARVSAKGAHRKYKDLICQTLDEDEHLVPHPGTDGRDFKWEDSVLLNYRKKATWDLMVSEIKEWAVKGVSGVRLDAAHSWPLILQPDIDELLRKDSDGEYHYDLQQIMDGEVVQASRTEGMTYGFHGTTAAQTYPNPLFIKMTRDLWKEFPTFVFLAEVYWNREVNAVISGVVPYIASLPISLASLFNLELHKDGRITYSAEKKNVTLLYNWYEIERARFPQNSILLYPSSSHFLPYPTSILGQAAWAVVDLLYFLPEIPFTYIGEQFGWMMNPHVSKGKFIPPDTNKHNASRDLKEVKGHYEHRASLRRNYPVLRDGGMIPLFAFYNDGWHDRVFAFARFTKHDGPQIAVIAINFNDVESYFYIDCSSLKEIVETGGNFLIRTVDLVNPANPPQYYTTQEFLYEKNFVRLAPHTSLCLGVFAEAQTATTERVLYEHSMIRLQRNLLSSVEPTNNHIYDLLITKGLESLNQFKEALLDITKKQGPGSENNIPPFLQSVLYYTTWGRDSQELKAMSYLTKLASEISGDPLLKAICANTLQSNTMGPIVFVTPEIGRFSTVGGVGVMVNELTQALAALGFDIHIISPYYNYNRKGQTGYLKAEGIDYSQNVITYVGNEYVEVGVHKGKEFGVNLYFLHNWKYFTTPYHMGSPTHQLQSIVLMAKASLELCCQFRILPSLIVTNDWWTGLVPAYAKRSGAFGTTFQGTTFFHVVHNLEEGYEGKIYPEDDEDDFGYIHQLSRDLIVDPYGNCVNASRCALLSCDQWGTVSISYKNDLMKTSPLSGLLSRFIAPFGKLDILLMLMNEAHNNGIRLQERLALLKKVSSSHEDAKAKLQQKYFGNSDPNIPIFSFVGRIVLQKGVHLILNSVSELLNATGGKIQIIIGGMANMKDPYAAQCAWSMQGLRRQFPNNFWADPNEFFSDGPLLNLGSDYGLMPSLFEPSGVVQQEYFAGGTPVIVFKTGGLKDTVFEYESAKGTGNGFTFEAHAHSDFVQAVKRSLTVFHSKEQYAKLRKNAYDSVLDVETVAVAWVKEFTRLRRRNWVPPAQIEKFIQEKLIEENKGNQQTSSTSTSTKS